MHIADLIQHTHTANRLQAASAALAACNTSLQDEPQVFQFAGANFSGADAIAIKHALMNALDSIAVEAQGYLVKAGIEFPPELPRLPLTKESHDPRRATKKGGRN